MHLGLFGINMGRLGADPAAMVDVARAAEAAGWESVWTGEHIVLPDPHAPPSPAPPETPMVDTAATLAFLAAATVDLRLGSGIIILPQRQPAVLAKSLAGVAHLSGGRLIAGFGVGYIPAELEACGADLATRAARTDEYLTAMRALWSDDAVDFDGRFVRFRGVSANPKPPGGDIPVVIGGHSEAAARRAVASGHGWYGFMRDLDAVADDVARLRRAADEVDRPAHLGRLEVSITPARTPQPDDLEAYAAAGVDRLILQPGGHRDRDEVLDYLTRFDPRGIS